MLVSGVVSRQVAVGLEDEFAFACDFDFLPFVEALVGVHAEGVLRLHSGGEKQGKQEDENACLHG